MTNKKLTPLFVAASFMLIGCSSSTIVARPFWQTDKIFNNVGDKDNKMKSIYDAVKALGDTNANVLTSLLRKISETNLGTFNELRTIYYTKVENYHLTDDFKNFLASHSTYKVDDSTEGVQIIDGKQDVKALSNDEKLLVSLNRVRSQYEVMVENIYEKLYDEIKGGSYSENITKLYNEEYFYNHVRRELYTTKEKSQIASFVKGKLFTPKDKDTNWKNFVNCTNVGGTGFLQVADADGNPTGIYDDYIDRKILPELYKTYLIQTYVKEQRYSSLGRSYARKVNMLTVPYSEKNKGNINTMLECFSSKYIVEPNSPSYDFEIVTRAMNGIVGLDDQSNRTPEFELLNSHIGLDGDVKKSIYELDSNFTAFTHGSNAKIKYHTTQSYTISGKTITDTYVYKGTKLGDLVEKIQTCCDVYYLTTGGEDPDVMHYVEKKVKTDAEKKVFNELTNNSAYDLETGIKLKEEEILKTDLTTDGWFLKNGGLTDLNSDYRDRLFNIATSNQIDDTTRKTTTFEGIGDYIKYFGTTTDVTNRKAFLKSKNAGSAAYDSIVINDGSKNFHIIEVEEAANSSKLTTSGSNDNSYIRIKATSNNRTDSVVAADKIAKDVIKINATGDTYKNNANQYYLMISNIIFYDQSVYDYFKSQFPDLFK